LVTKTEKPLTSVGPENISGIMKKFSGQTTENKTVLRFFYLLLKMAKTETTSFFSGGHWCKKITKIKSGLWWLFPS
jgi:hypothetical protein